MALRAFRFIHSNGTPLTGLSPTAKMTPLSGGVTTSPAVAELDASNQPGVYLVNLDPEPVEPMSLIVDPQTGQADEAWVVVGPEDVYGVEDNFRILSPVYSDGRLVSATLARYKSAADVDAASNPVYTTQVVATYNASGELTGFSSKVV